MVDDDRVWSTARADAGGIPWDRRRGRLLVPVTRGRYVHTADRDDPDAVFAALLDAVPSAALSHWSAASVWGAPVSSARLSRVHVSVVSGTSRPARAGVVAHHAAELPVTEVRGLRVTTALRTWLDLATSGASTADLVVVGDAFGRLGAATPEHLSAVALRAARRRGARRMREAAGLIDPRAESGPETRLRLVLAGALPAPEVNHVVRDPRGSFVARVDLAWPDVLLAVEYDGEHHRDRGQWVRDLRRRERLESLGWTVVVLTAADLRGPRHVLLTRVRARHEAARRRHHPA